MILADTSAWVEALRDTRSAVAHALARAESDDELATTETVVGELLLGVVDERARDVVIDRLGRLTFLGLGGVQGFVDAADLYRQCRKAGVTVRKYTDCLIAVPAIRADAAVLHADKDFDRMARVSALRVVAV